MTPKTEQQSEDVSDSTASSEHETASFVDAEDASIENQVPFEAEQRIPPPIGFRQWWNEPSLSGEGKQDQTVQLALIFVAMLIYMTQLGFGLWDCWEPHYAETARMMLVRKDWVHPFWSYAYFLSKPVLMFWYMAASMSVFGVNEWAIRLPFAAHAVLLIWSTYFIVSRLFSRRTGLLAAIVVGTSPLTTFLGRQAITDILVGTYVTMALGFLALAIFGHRQVREKAILNGFEVPIHVPYLYLGYALLGLALLAKGLLGLGLPVIVVGGYLLFTWDWRILLRIRLISGSLVMLSIALPWYLHMSFFPGRNIEDGKTFFTRFILHDNVYRLFRGVHGDRGFFSYFVRQLGYATGLWAGFIPLGLASVARFQKDTPDAHEKLMRFLFAWWMMFFLFFSLSSTKFHHYVYPLVPISGILVALWLDRFLECEDRSVYRFGVLVALGLFWIVIRDILHNPHHLVNMFVYKYSRPYPWQDPMLLGGTVWRFSFLFFKGVFRPSPQTFFGLFSAIFAAFMLSGYFYNARRYLIQGVVGVSIVWTIFHAHIFMVKLTPHWSQKPLFAIMKQDSALWKKKLSANMALSNALQEKIPDEPLLAFRMNWRGEKFYSGNRDIQIMGTHSFERLYDALQRHRKPGRPVYFLTESTRLKDLKRAVGSYDKKLLRIPIYVRQKRRVGGKGTLRAIRPFVWKKATAANVRRFTRYHNKYLLVKLLPKPTGEVRSSWRLKRDRKDRQRGDEWRRRWWYDKRAKKWRERRWWRLKQKRMRRNKRRRRKERALRLRQRMKRQRALRLLQLRQRKLLHKTRPALKKWPSMRKKPALSLPTSRPTP